MGSQRGNLRSRETEDNSPRWCWRSKVRRYCRMISGMLMRNAAEKFWIAISI